MLARLRRARDVQAQRIRTALLARGQIDCDSGCSKCCTSGFLVDTVDALVAYRFLVDHEMWAAWQPRLLAHAGCACVFLDGGACAIYPARPVACSITWGQAGVCGGVLVADVEHAAAAREVIEAYRLTADLRTLTEAILVTARTTEGRRDGSS